MHKTIKHIHQHAQVLRDTHVPSDERGVLAEPAREVLKRSGGMRLRLYDALSIWGHKAPAEPLPPGILQPIEASA